MEPVIATLLSLVSLAVLLALLRFPIKEDVLFRAEAAGVPWMPLKMPRSATSR